MRPEDAVCGWARCTRSSVHDVAPLCMHHLIKAWSIVQNFETEIPGHIRPIELDLKQPAVRNKAAKQLSYRPIRLLPGTHVYYLRLRHGDIKTGYSTDVIRRIASLRLDEDALLAVEPGDQQLEHLRHRQFAALRIGRREDFTAGSDLLSHIAMLCEHFGQPADLIELVPTG